MKKTYSRPRSLKERVFHYCPGCGHSIIHRLICEVIDDMNIQESVIGIPPPGCAVFAHQYFDVDMVESAHGRGAAVATGIKRAYPEAIVFTYQGDGDLAAIGVAETIHAASRGEAISIFFINNAIYGMTGGQMAPTTLLGQKTATSPFGRDALEAGYPLRVCELLSSLPGAVYLERIALNSPANISKTRRAIRKSFLTQIEKKKFSLVEILSPCPTAWRLSPLKALEWLEENMIPYYPLGVIKEE